MVVSFLQLNNLSKTLKNRIIFNEVSLSLQKGEKLSILGASGSGKTTLARVITGFLPFDSGSIYFKGKERPSKPSTSIQLVHQNPFDSLTPHLSVNELIKTKKTDPNFLSYLLHQLNLTQTTLNAHSYHLSGGEAQRVALLRALLQKPDILICDEILSSLDMPQKKQIICLLNQFNIDLGLSIIWVTHDLLLAKQVSDRFVVLDEQRLSGVLDFRMKSFSHPYIRRLETAMKYLEG